MKSAGPTALMMAVILCLSACEGEVRSYALLGSCVIDSNDICIDMVALLPDDQGELHSTMVDAGLNCELLDGVRFDPAKTCAGIYDAQYACERDETFYGRSGDYEGFTVTYYLEDYDSDSGFDDEERDCTLSEGEWLTPIDLPIEIDIDIDIDIDF